MPSISARTIYLLAGALLLIMTTVLCARPLVVSIDSVYGFFAYKGTLATGEFNVLQDISFTDISQTEEKFVSWWAPGQWIFPGVLNYLFGLPLGIASIVVTVLFALFGLAGFYRVFRHFNFSKEITAISLLIIILSFTFYQSFIIYQGGEIISFGVFPWFLLYVLRLERYSFRELLVFLLLLLLCLAAKTTLVIYCALTLLYKLVEEILSRRNQQNKWSLSGSAFLLCVPFFAAMVFFFWYTSLGPSPSFLQRFGVSANDFLVPLSSPLTAILSIQVMLGRSEALLTRFSSPQVAALCGLFILLLLSAASIFLLRFIQRSKQFPPSYKRLSLLLYTGISLFFIVGYLFDTNIDQSARHFKLLAFLLVPGLLQLLATLFNYRTRVLLMSGFVVLLTGDFIFSKFNWTHDRYIAKTHFYRNFDNMNELDRLDRETYRKLLALDASPVASKAILLVEANPDIALDLQRPCVFVDNRNDFYSRPYQGQGPTVYAFVTRQTLQQRPGFLQWKLPGYTSFALTDSSRGYLLYTIK